MNDSYTKLHEFLERQIPENEVYKKESLSGRVTTLGKYFFYAKRDVRNAQRDVPHYIKGYLLAHDAPSLLLDFYHFYEGQDLDVQILINIVVLCYVIFIQLYFCRYLLCDSCFREYEQLQVDID